jgi:hypothetical protein
MADVESKPWDSPAWASDALAAEFEQLPRVGVLQSARRHWLIVLLPVLVLVPVVAVVAARRTPTYSAEARLIVGRLNLSTPGAIAGFAQAAQDLAATYPLVIYANGVVKPVARKLHMSPSEVLSGISATEVPSSSVIRVDATAKSAIIATSLANAASKSLIAYLAGVDRHNPALPRLSKLLQRYELVYQQAKARVPTGNQPLTPAGEKLVAAAETARVELNGVIQSYDNELQNQAGTPLLQPITYAAGATSDRMSKLQLAVFGALLVGLLLGLALATLRANLALKRALTVPGWQPTMPGGRSESGMPADNTRSLWGRRRSRS